MLLLTTWPCCTSTRTLLFQEGPVFFFLEYAGELRIIVLKGEEESYINSHTDTLKTHTETHIHTRTRKTKDTGPPPIQSTRDTTETWPKCQWLANTHGGEQGQALGSWHAPQMGFILCHDQGCSNAGCSTIKDTIIPMPPNGPTS